MKGIFWIGMVVLLLGIASLLIPFPRSHRAGISVAGHSVDVETTHNEKISPVLSAVMILGGAGMMIAGQARQ